MGVVTELFSPRRASLLVSILSVAFILWSLSDLVSLDFSDYWALEFQQDVDSGPSFRFESDPSPETLAATNTTWSAIGSCPGYFRFIEHDLAPWKEQGVTLDSLERAKAQADFILVILSGRMYVEHLHDCFESREILSKWGFLMLLQRYGTRVPDIALLFNCGDSPQFRMPSPDSPAPPAIFSYCSTDNITDILWPDFSFWGWPEVNVDPWDTAREKIVNASLLVTWQDRVPRAFWKGTWWCNGWLRNATIGCNDNTTHKWGVESYNIEWNKERHLNESRMENQCGYRYKIYVEGTTWSCGLKYFLSCASTPIFVHPLYYEFWSRALDKGRHFLEVPRPQVPVEGNYCTFYKNTIDSAESHPRESIQMGRAAARFMQEDLSMRYVYDYMLFVLQRYAALQRASPKDVLQSLCNASRVQNLTKEALAAERIFLRVDEVQEGLVPCFEQ